ncbi:hypothetical protein [Listeria immobilis]|uniref:hypothetical protein n=1 Tax=Listeria immobilis TaxID=2713502 RepID=UPI001625332D|nr:hypothetical protein [Listeria immobilis]
MKKQAEIMSIPFLKMALYMISAFLFSNFYCGDLVMPQPRFVYFVTKICLKS